MSEDIEELKAAIEALRKDMSHQFGVKDQRLNGSLIFVLKTITNILENLRAKETP